MDNTPIKPVRAYRKLPIFSPTETAELELKALADDQEIIPIRIIGRGTLTTEQIAENERREKLADEKRLAIIRKHGVVPEYIEKSEKNIARLQEKIFELRAMVTAERAWIRRLRN